ncbi:MAG: hypothetical protein FGM50_12320, partial [Mycobacterium sp.]|nr:hypothetical protein [Mycobacterium sp.]
MPEAATANARAGAGRHIGRVGGLALALGIGAAIAALPAVASADTGDAADSAGTTRSASKATPSRGPSSVKREAGRGTAAAAAASRT